MHCKQNLTEVVPVRFPPDPKRTAVTFCAPRRVWSAVADVLCLVHVGACHGKQRARFEGAGLQQGFGSRCCDRGRNGSRCRPKRGRHLGAGVSIRGLRRRYMFGRRSVGATYRRHSEACPDSQQDNRGSQAQDDAGACPSHWSPGSRSPCRAGTRRHHPRRGRRRPS